MTKPYSRSCQGPQQSAAYVTVLATIFKGQWVSFASVEEHVPEIFRDSDHNALRNAHRSPDVYHVGAKRIDGTLCYCYFPPKSVPDAYRYPALADQRYSVEEDDGPDVDLMRDEPAGLDASNNSDDVAEEQEENSPSLNSMEQEEEDSPTLNNVEQEGVT